MQSSPREARPSPRSRSHWQGQVDACFTIHSEVIKAAIKSARPYIHLQIGVVVISGYVPEDGELECTDYNGKKVHPKVGFFSYTKHENEKRDYLYVNKVESASQMDNIIGGICKLYLDATGNYITPEDVQAKCVQEQALATGIRPGTDIYCVGVPANKRFFQQQKDK